MTCMDIGQRKSQKPHAFVETPLCSEAKIPANLLYILSEIHRNVLSWQQALTALLLQSQSVLKGKHRSDYTAGSGRCSAHA